MIGLVAWSSSCRGDFLPWRKDLGFDRDRPNFGEFRPFWSDPKRILCFKSRNFTELSPKLDRILPKFVHFGWDRIFFPNESQNLIRPCSTARNESGPRETSIFSASSEPGRRTRFASSGPGITNRN